MTINNIINNMSAETLMRLAPKVERAANGTASRSDRAYIHSEVGRHTPRQIEGEHGVIPPIRELNELRRQRFEATGCPMVGPGMLTLGADGRLENASVTTFGNVAEMREAMQNAHQNMIRALMDAITAMRADGVTIPGSNFNAHG